MRACSTLRCQQAQGSFRPGIRMLRWSCADLPAGFAQTFVPIVSPITSRHIQLILLCDSSGERRLAPRCLQPTIRGLLTLVQRF